MSAMTPIYWRRIKAGTRTYASIPDEAIKAEVKQLAKADVVSGVITAEEYKQLIGEDYAE